MLVCFRCAPETKDRLDTLVASGAYRDHGEVISAAVMNLVLMEKEFASNGQVVIDGSTSGNGDGEATPGERPTVSQQNRRKKRAVKKKSPQKKPKVGKSMGRKEPTEAKTPVAAAKEELMKRPHIPRIFLRDALPDAEPRGLADLAGDMWAHGQEVPLDRWVLGQFNRLLPAKVNARALIHLFVREKGGLEIARAAEMVATEALNLGDYLAAIDEERKVARDDALATAFPQRRKDPEKGRTRYANQFVVYQNGRGELSGLMIDLKLINVEICRRERRIIPTHTAWDLAQMENPILDGAGNGAVQKFSDQERAFLVEHVLRGVPVESFAYRVILETVMQGDNTPEKIDGALKKYVSQDRAEQLSQSFLTSQRSGAVSRMSDVGLIERHREGVRVIYGVTKQGEQFLSQYTNAGRA